MTGMKLPIKVLLHLDHSIGYDFVSEIETAKAEVAQMFKEKETGNLPEESTTNCLILLFGGQITNFNQTLKLTGCYQFDLFS